MLHQALGRQRATVFVAKREVRYLPKGKGSARGRLKFGAFGILASASQTRIRRHIEGDCTVLCVGTGGVREFAA